MTITKCSYTETVIMPTIVTIGGGENGRPGTTRETQAIDKKIVEMTGKASPRFLFVGTASYDNPGYIALMKKNYEFLGCETDYLPLENGELTDLEIQQKIERADIVYVGGGNTQHMISLRKERSVDTMLKNIFTQKNSILCGVSAGSICRFDAGQSDSQKFENTEGEKSFSYIKVDGIGLLPAIHTPHFDTEKSRQESRPQFVKNYGGTGLAIENNCAIIFQNDQYMVIDSKPSAQAYCCKIIDEKYQQTPIKKHTRLPNTELW